MAIASTFVFKRPSVLPGFGLALGFTLVYLILIVLIPLGGLILRTASLGQSEIFRIVTDPRTVAALRLSFGTAVVAAASEPAADKPATIAPKVLPVPGETFVVKGSQAFVMLPAKAGR